MVRVPSTIRVKVLFRAGEYLTHGYNQSYTQVMKTAISIPDQVFESAEKLARRRGTSRSELYAQALSDYLDRNSDGLVKESLDRVYDDSTGKKNDIGKVDKTLSDLQSETIRRDQW